MSEYKKISHVIYRCTYHIVWVPKYRFRVLEGLVKELLTKDIQMLLEWKSCELIEMNIQIDHIHLIVSIPPKISVSQLMGILKGKTAIKIFKSYPQLKKKPYWGNHFWARGYCVAQPPRSRAHASHSPALLHLQDQSQEEGGGCDDLE